MPTPSRGHATPPPRAPLCKLEFRCCRPSRIHCRLCKVFGGRRLQRAPPKCILLYTLEREMAQASTIEWTESTWNPVTGCTKISPGCKNCYAKRMAERLQLMGQPNYANGFDLTLQPRALELPLRWKKPQRIFVNSMSDLFHDDVPLDYI